METTKKQLLKAMENMDDDAQIRIYCTSADMDGGLYAYDTYIDDIGQNEVTIVAHF